MLDVSSQTSEDPFYQRVLRLVKTLVSARARKIYRYILENLRSALLTLRKALCNACGVLWEKFQSLTMQWQMDVCLRLLAGHELSCPVASPSRCLHAT